MNKKSHTYWKWKQIITTLKIGPGSAQVFTTKLFPISGNLLSLSRWREHLPFVIPLSLLGAIFGSALGQPIDFRLIAVTLANILTVAYAFMINEIEDAPDDANDPNRTKINPIAAGIVSRQTGLVTCQLLAILSLFLFSLGGITVLFIGLFNLLLSHLYSWRGVRLKAFPLIDVISHVLMLGTLLFLATFYTYHNKPGSVWWVISALSLFSLYGQLYNQIRDFIPDKKAGLRNTSIMLGKRNSTRVMYLALIAAILSIAAAAIKRVFPIWLIGLSIFLFIAAIYWPSTSTDLRGNSTFESTGRYQAKSMLILNIITGLWFIQTILF